MSSASILTPSTFTLADRLKFQQESMRRKEYVTIGKLTDIVFEAQRSTKGLSQSRARYTNSRQAGMLPESLKPFSERQAVLWASTTLTWLNHKNAPLIALSRDHRDLLFPSGLTPLPAIPDPTWVPTSTDEIAPRIPQLLTGCHIVGDRVADKIKARDGKTWGVIHPILELCVMMPNGGVGGFGRIRGGVDPADGTHLALLINEDQTEAYFVGGRFQFGG